MLHTLISFKTHLRILIFFFIKSAKNVHLRSLAEEMNEFTMQPLYNALKNSIFQPVGLDAVMEIFDAETNVKNILV